jgi:anti-sigma-K factor RskA
MSVHEQFAEDLALYALSALKGDERVTLEKHLQECASCRRELEQLRGDMALMALSTAGAAPPQRARQRLMSAIKLEPRRKPVSTKPSWWRSPGWISVAAMALLVALLAVQNSRLGNQLNAELSRVRSLENSLAFRQNELQQAHAMISTLSSPDAQIVQVTEPNAPPRPQGKAFYVKDRSTLMFIATNMPALPPEKAYELWLIPANGSAPIPAGVFKPDARGNATVMNAQLPAGVEAKAFAITIEREQGSLTPTLPIRMIGS